MKTVVSIIAAVADNGVIGAGGAMPWRLPTDMRRFKQLTLGKPVVMGRKTYESIGKPLPGRTNIVVTRQADFRPEGVLVADSLEAALELAIAEAGKSGAAEIMVMGGGELYRQAIGRAGRLYITHVHAEPHGDARFPPIDPSRWREGSREAMAGGQTDSAACHFVVYERLPGDV
jgi:dihydrofolate reductase